jgi:hypothetical protein
LLLGAAFAFGEAEFYKIKAGKPSEHTKIETQLRITWDWAYLHTPWTWGWRLEFKSFVFEISFHLYLFIFEDSWSKPWEISVHTRQVYCSHIPMIIWSSNDQD